jgi:type II secretory pathway pseudopilin PulG
LWRFWGIAGLTRENWLEPFCKWFSISVTNYKGCHFRPKILESALPPNSGTMTCDPASTLPSALGRAASRRHRARWPRQVFGSRLAGFVSSPAADPQVDSPVSLEHRSLCAEGATSQRILSVNARRAFTLLELLIVIGIMIALTALVVPAFTNLKSSNDLTSAANATKDALDTARTYAKANNTYTWVGFAGSIGTTAASVTGRVQVAIVASKDGTSLWSANGSLPPASLTQIGKMITLDNVHIGDTGTPDSTVGSDFENRATVDANYKIASAANTAYPFTVQQTTFNKWIQFSPRGEALVDGGTFSIVHYSEVGVLPTHGTALAVTQSGGKYLGNVVAIQISGYGGGVRLYRR